MSFHLDSTDKKILTYLSRNAREKVVDIANYLGVTSAAIHQRLAKIKKAGIIKDFTIKMNEKEIGYTTCAFIGVFLETTSKYKEAVTKMQSIREIVEVHYTTGQYGLFVKLYARDNDHLMQVLNGEIQRIKGVQRTETFISLDVPISRNISFLTDDKS